MMVLSRSRARGPLLWTLRIVGLGALLTAVFSYNFGSLGLVPLLLSVLVGLGWQLWLFRPCVLVTMDSVILRGLWSDTILDAQSINKFCVKRKREPLDYYSRAVKLIVCRVDEVEIVCRWVQWQEYITATIGGEPTLPTRSQARVVERLNSALVNRRSGPSLK